jgi:hypothetical protein
MHRLLQEHYRHYMGRLGQALLACPSLNDRDRRGALLRDLPGDVRHQLGDNLPTPTLIIQDLVKTCANRERGEDALFQTLDNHEMGSVTFQRARREWRTIRREMDEQDQLIAWIKGSSVSFAELKRLFEAVVPLDYAALSNSVETLTQALWGVPAGHTPLIKFMQGLQARQELPRATREAIAAWIAEAERNDLLRPLEVDDRPAPLVDTRLIITIEFGKQDLSKRLVSLWVDEAGEISMLHQFRIEGARLEQALSNEIDIWTIAYAATEAIEFYLPKALLAAPIDSWKIKAGELEQRFIERYHIVKGILERQEARLIRTRLESAVSNEERRELVMALRNNPLIQELTRRSGDWEKRWRQLHNHMPILFTAVAQALKPDDPLSPADNTAFVLLTFNPPDLDSIQLDDPIGRLMIAGVPLLAWVRAVGEDADLEAYARERLFDAHCDCPIGTADDVIKLMHAVCRETGDTVVQRQISQNLNLIADNPESKLPPDFGRVRM